MGNSPYFTPPPLLRPIPTYTFISFDGCPHPIRKTVHRPRCVLISEPQHVAHPFCR